MNLPVRVGGKQSLPALWSPEESAPEQPLRLRRILAFVGGFFLLITLLAAVIPIQGAVIATGQVGAESRVKRIAHPTGGVIAQIAVINGQHVKQGQLLMRLDDRVTLADATYSNLTVEQLLAQKARLEAERLGSDRIIYPPELLQSSQASAQRAMADETRLFEIRRSEQGQIRAQLAARVAQFGQQIAGYNAQIRSLATQRQLIEPERQSVKELWDKQLVTISRLNQLERTAADLDGNIASLQAQIAATQARISEAQEQAIQLGDSRRAEAGAQLSQVNTALNQQQLRSVAAIDQQDRSEIRAPYSGTIEKIAFSAIGDVVRPAEPIMEIVPDADQMVVEAAIRPEDIDQVRVGQAASIRFTSYNRAATPEIHGKVLYVATDRSENAEARTAYYVARIGIDQAAVRSEKLDLRSGMPAETYIQTGARSMLSYLLKPLFDQLARSFRDS